MMTDLIKKNLEQRKSFDKTNSTIAIIIAIVVHIIIFVGVREFKAKPRVYQSERRPVFQPITYQIPKKQIEDRQIKRTDSIYRPKERPIPKAVPDPQREEDILPEIPEHLLTDDTPQYRQVGAIIPPMLIRRQIPEYPSIAREMGLEGDVKVRCTLDTQGRVTRVVLAPGGSSGSDILDKAALNGAGGCIFTPAKQGDVAMGDIDVEITYRFRLVGIEIY